MKKIFFKKNNKRNQGLTLVETLVAISIFTISILGMLFVIAKGISDTNYAKRKIVAEYLAQEGIEYVRNLRDTKVLYPPSGQTAQDIWDIFRENSTSLDLSGLPSYSDSSFVRTITKNKISDDEIKITSIVSWMQGSGTYNVTFSENIYNWIE